MTWIILSLDHFSVGIDNSFLMEPTLVPEMVQEVQESNGDSHSETVPYSQGNGACKLLAKALSISFVDLFQQSFDP